MSLGYVKTLTGDNPQVGVIYNRYEELLKNKLKGIGEDEVPRELEYIVEELTIRRFNRIGDEGMSSVSSEGLSITYQEGGVFGEFESDIKDYIIKKKGGKRRSRVRFI